MEKQPWVRFLIPPETFFIKTLTFESNFHLLLTDLKDIWEAKLNEEQLRHTSARLNTRFEMDLDHIQKTLNECTQVQVEKAKYSLEKWNDDDLVVFRFQVPYFNFQYYWEFHCRRAEHSLLYQHVTRPLLLTSWNLERKIVHLKVRQSADG